MKREWIWLDMDGTIADLYGVDNWLEYILARNTKPYAVAKCLYDFADLFTILAEKKMQGYNIGIISWGSKERNANYDEAVAKVKKEWLYNLCLDLIIDKIIVTAYGVCKADTCRQYGNGILVDDEKQNRDSWDLGLTIDANTNIIEALKNI